MNDCMFCFVILHYMVAKETISTVDSIDSTFSAKYKIIVVDNCSPNHSFEILKKKYQDNSNVDVIQNISNAGYAKGINFGYNYALTHYSPDFVIAMNNDMEIKQKNFLNLICKIFDETHFHVLGPDIYSTSAFVHQNPEKSVIRNMRDVENHIKQVEKIKNGKFKLKVKGFFRGNKSFYKLYKKIKSTHQNEETHTVLEGCALHGACLIFSRPFIEAREYALYPETEFYCEAQILDYECHRDSLVQIYDSDLKIYHHEDVATDAVAGSYYNKMIKKCDRVIQSLQIFKKLIENDSKGKV